ncbi:type II toxin-antitoxin system VapC family toxin [Armatimonas sp.]|uniref:type II toxin-antitoxin system VapC family toxin n=1 Tax=Armatimonas sp. TaxID=1872638 RepID=UPI00286C1C67|nr:type II toxin-antitoxin system VapC family toxin [Armatimonas sp.]
MTALLDTHTLLWQYWGDSQQSHTAQQIINDPSNIIYVSVASLWEITIKVSQQKLDLKDPITRFFQDAVEGSDLRILPVERFHLITLVTLPLHHRDPFDRLLIAQSISEKMPIISADTAFDNYPVTRIW